MRELKQYRFWFVAGAAFGLILFLDQLYLLGIPFGGFLGDLSGLDPTKRDDLHHWMLGLVIFVACAILYRRAIQE
jgi:hypothetical protein